MPRARSVCRRHGCPHLVLREGLCEAHAGEQEVARGSSAQRGYGAAHRAARAAYERRLRRGEVLACWRCGRPLRQGDEWDLGHDDSGVTRGPEHARTCNRRAAGLKAHGQDFRPAEGRTQE